MGKTLLVFRVKEDMPSVEEARQRLYEFLEASSGRETGLVKLVHGYGSTGKGGKLRHALRRSLGRMAREGKLVTAIPGEAWNSSSEQSKALLARYPWLRDDPDLNRANPGITVIEIRHPGRGRNVTRQKEARVQKGVGDLPALRPSRSPQEVERLVREDPSRLYDAYSQPHMIRRLKEDA